MALDRASERFIQQFELGTIDASDFGHREHVRLAWCYLHAFGIVESLTRFPTHLKRFAKRVGAPNLYHETLTWAFLLMINERQQCQPGIDWQQFVTRNEDLLRWPNPTLSRLYPQDVLESEIARRVFVMPPAPVEQASA